MTPAGSTPSHPPPSEKAGTSRPRRADAGQIRITERDLKVLQFVAEQYGIRADQLPRLVGDVSERTLRALVDRWVGAGWVNRRKILAHSPAWLWPTRDGLALLPRRFNYWEPSPGMLEHVYWVNEVRFRTLQRHPQSEWVPERILRAERKVPHSDEHTPDGVVLRAGKEIAVEVQLQQKSRDRALTTLQKVTADYDGVWLFARPGAVTDAFSRALQEISPDHSAKVRLLSLDGLA